MEELARAVIIKGTHGREHEPIVGKLRNRTSKHRKSQIKQMTQKS